MDAEKDSTSSSLNRHYLLSARRIPGRLLWALTPQVFRVRVSHQAETTLRKSAYLDGLRGLAAVVVINFHFFFAFSNGHKIGYGHDATHRSLWELPFIRLTYDGALGVNIFFAVAGYVCSASVLRLMTTGQHEKVVRSLSTSAFRTTLRLWLPVFVCTFISAVLAHLGFFDIIRDITLTNKLPERSLRRTKFWSAQFLFWAKEMRNLTNVWRIEPMYPEHDAHLWSIPFEFRGRMHLYVCLLIMTLCRPKVRLGGLVALACIYDIWDRWDGPLFFLGAALAQWNLLYPTEPEGSLTSMSPPPEASNVVGSAKKPLRLFLYTLSLYLMSYPTGNIIHPAPGYSWATKLIPPWLTYQPWRTPITAGVMLFLYLLSTCHDVQHSIWHRVLTSSITQHLGKIMFGLYLVHGPVLHIFGWGIPFAVWSVIGRDTYTTWCVGLGVGWICSLFASLWFAEIFTREVDARLVQLVQFFERRFFES